MQARLGAVKRRKKSVEITAGLSAESNGFFLFRKRNPIEQLEQRKATHQSSSDGPQQDDSTDRGSTPSDSAADSEP
jgi:hypothetical protein